jgi:DNA end-binding protein Ku
MATSIWKGHLTFGLVSFPVRLFTAARSESISFNQLHKEDNSRIKQVIYCQAEDKPIPRSEIVKGYEYEKGKYVVIEDEDIKKVAPKNRQGDGDPGVRQGRRCGPGVPRKLLLHGAGRGRREALFTALRGYAGDEVFRHREDRHAQPRACGDAAPGRRGMVLHTMYYADEVRRSEEFRTDSSNLKEKELALAKMLVESLAGDFEPEKYHDAYRDNLKKMIDAKIEGHKVVETPEAHIAPVDIDIMEALKKEPRNPPAQAYPCRSSVSGPITAQTEIHWLAPTTRCYLLLRTDPRLSHRGAYLAFSGSYSKSGSTRNREQNP